MGIADIGEQFQAKVGDSVKLIRLTMDYADGGAVQRFLFRVQHGGATNTIEHDCRGAVDIDDMIAKVADKATTWAEKS